MTEGTNKRTTNTDDNSSLSNRLTRTTIREANNHLQMLYERNQELEQIINEQNQELHKKDSEYQKLSKSNQLLERHCQQLQALLEDRTRRLYAYERKEVLFRETLELKPAIESLLEVLNTFEQVDSASSLPSIPINFKPLQFVPPSNKKSNNNVHHQIDTL
ncbi:unnamed protein product [Rotaria magnacalcarata]|uniref:Uncharacterized protein n=1 Tax=Rotaria magnacalcarata TaxID=392030 RepID=A0A816QUX5_9BILA|nr:unnamed protein product [Rotaria magnacalcarata]CAF2099926.1 unnamed protein product [Rotaria magnacalcarata]CAF3862674.1 unnamed protein product [Rotaria magnacalcarata]CAF4415750.1 unnamed protein product [Rotaria magnacalcarata]